MRACFEALELRLRRLDPGCGLEQTDVLVPMESYAGLVVTPWTLSFTSLRGKSKMVNVLELVYSFLDANGFQSQRSPLCVAFKAGCAPGNPAPEFSVVHLVGFGRSLAARVLLMEISVLEPNLTDEQFLELGKLLQSLLRIHTVVEASHDDKHLRFSSLRSKLQVSESVRPDVLQLYHTFGEIVAKSGQPLTQGLKALVQEFNKGSTVQGHRVSELETKVLLQLPLQTPGFHSKLQEHWQNFRLAESAVPMKFFHSLLGPWRESQHALGAVDADYVSIKGKE